MASIEHQSQAEGSPLNPHLPKRFRLEAIPDDVDAATRALDLESDEVPEKLKCPICMEVPLGEVLQCPNGHTICKDCQTKSGKVTCFQCRKGMKSVDGDWIRNRFMEEILDSHWFLCPFRENGCEKVLSRGNVLKHKEECVLNGDCIQICRFFHERANCEYFTRLSKPHEALVHLARHLDKRTFLDENRNGKWWFPVTRKTTSDYAEAAVTRKNGGTFMTVGWNNKETGQLSFVCLRMDKAAPGQPEPTTVQLTFENQKKHSKIPNWSLMLPIISVVEAEPILKWQMKLVSVPRWYLENNFLDDDFDKPLDGCLKVTIEIL